MSIRIAASIIFFFVFSGVAARAATEPGSPRMPFAFIENRGQTDPSVRYIGTGPEFRAWFQDRGVVLRHGRTTLEIAFEGSAGPRGATPQSMVATRAIGIGAENPIGARANYLYGSDPSRWRTNLPLFGSIRYSGLWDGVDLIYKAEDGRLKAEYLVAPGASVGRNSCCDSTESPKFAETERC